MKTHLSRTEVIAKLRSCVKEKGSQKALAYEIGVTEQYLSDILNWKSFGPAILNYLKLEAVTVTTYREKE